jgi:F0F1-type ATP synthase assembly protein I
MKESGLRVSLVIFAGCVVAWLIGWALDKMFPKSKSQWRDAILFGACICVAMMLDSLLSK